MSNPPDYLVDGEPFTWDDLLELVTEEQGHYSKRMMETCYTGKEIEQLARDTGHTVLEDLT